MFIGLGSLFFFELYISYFEGVFGFLLVFYKWIYKGNVDEKF